MRHTDALTGGPGRSWCDNMHQLDPGHWLYDAFTHTRGWGRDLSLALALGKSTDVDLPLAQLALQNLAAGWVCRTRNRRSDDGRAAP